MEHNNNNKKKVRFADTVKEQHGNHHKDYLSSLSVHKYDKMLKQQVWIRKKVSNHQEKCREQGLIPMIHSIKREAKQQSRYVKHAVKKEFTKLARDTQYEFQTAKCYSEDRCINEEDLH
jgi:hypothetical protein